MGRELNPNAAVVLLSGGQDSATCLAWAINKFNPVYALSFVYGQRHAIELNMSEELAIMAQVQEHKILDLLVLRQLGGSALVQPDSDISAEHEEDSDLPASFVPGRNLLFLSVAAAYAYHKKAKHLITGVCQTDYSGYPDCRDASIKAIQVAVRLCMEADIILHTPLMWKTKAETCLMMKELGKFDWYEFTHTCYEGKRPPCGECPACKLRAAGFKEAGLVDPLENVGE
jgi:7-cyano-7-deazaguanine synthase